MNRAIRRIYTINTIILATPLIEFLSSNEIFPPPSDADFGFYTSELHMIISDYLTVLGFAIALAVTIDAAVPDIIVADPRARRVARPIEAWVTGMAMGALEILGDGLRGWWESVIEELLILDLVLIEIEQS
jgi:hypothetical protein